MVWCSRPTAELCRARLGVQRERLRVVDVGRPFRVDGVSCVFLDANHCPGAVMVLFDDIPGGSGPVLATGDFRFHADMCENPTLRALSLRAPALMLDTTYCDPRHVFPPQRDVLAAVRDAVRAEAFNPKTLFLFGTYTIGKERVFFEAARALGKKVYVGAQKRKVLEALGSSLSDEDRASITSDDASTNLHVVPMGSTSFARMKTILRYYRARFDTVVAFKPTGWTFEQSRKHARATARRARGHSCSTRCRTRNTRVSTRVARVCLVFEAARHLAARGKRPRAQSEANGRAAHRADIRRGVGGARRRRRRTSGNAVGCTRRGVSSLGVDVAGRNRETSDTIRDGRDDGIDTSPRIETHAFASPSLRTPSLRTPSLRTSLRPASLPELLHESLVLRALRVRGRRRRRRGRVLRGRRRRRRGASPPGGGGGGGCPHPICGGYPALPSTGGGGGTCPPGGGGGTCPRGGGGGTCPPGGGGGGTPYAPAAPGGGGTPYAPAIPGAGGGGGTP